MLDYAATRNVGDIVEVPGPWFNSRARVIRFFEDSDPTRIKFEITESRHPSVKVGDVDYAIAGYCPVVEAAPAYVGRHAV